MARRLSTPFILGLSRVLVLSGILFLIHDQAKWREAQRKPPVSLRSARAFFPAAHRVQLRDSERGLYYVTNARGDTIGCLLRTSPQMDHIIGYSGPSDVLIALDAQGAVAGLELLRSGDTEEHVKKVKRDRAFFKTFLGWKPNEAPPPKVEGVSGATLTASAIAESVQQRLAGTAPSLRFPAPVTLADIQMIFTNAASFMPERARFRVLDRHGALLGYALRTSPQADNVSGYRGPTECLVALGPDGQKVLNLHVRSSYDTDSYIDQVRRDERYLKQFIGRTLDDLAWLEFGPEKIQGISGATQTTRAIAEGLKRRLVAENKKTPGPPAWKPTARDLSLAGVIAGALVMSWTSLRGHRLARLCWQLLLIGYVGLISHDLLSMALFGGWTTSGAILKAAPGLALLAGVSVLAPLFTRRQIYCHHICPHGAAQQLIGRASRWRWFPPGRIHGALELLPNALLIFIAAVLLLGWKIDLAALEPFDAWVWYTAGAATILLAIVGLAASFFIPLAYCRYGCPTGAFLNLLRGAGPSDRWSARDWAGSLVLLAALAIVITVRSTPRVEPEPEPAKFTGKAMGTTWTVKLDDEIADPEAVQKKIEEEFELAESLTSHWRTNTDVWRFNHTPDTNAVAMPWPVLTLAQWAADISRATGGAYDITVGPLARLWGFGPESTPRQAPPAQAEIAKVQPTVGWQKLEVLDGLLRKQIPELEIDLSSIAKGWAIDQVAEMIERRGYTNFLVEAGGELRARGRWQISIEHPPRSCALVNQSIATSGAYRQNFKSGTNVFSHLIDPRTGRPIAHSTVSVSVQYRNCALADAWATALNILGVEEGLPVAEQQNLAAQFVVQGPDGKLEIRQTSNWK